MRNEVNCLERKSFKPSTGNFNLSMQNEALRCDCGRMDLVEDIASFRKTPPHTRRIYLHNITLCRLHTNTVQLIAHWYLLASCLSSICLASLSACLQDVWLVGNRPKRLNLAGKLKILRSFSSNILTVTPDSLNIASIMS